MSKNTVPSHFDDTNLDTNPAFIAAVLDTAANLILVLDNQGRIVRFNRACEHRTGYKAEEVVGESLFELFLLPDERDAMREAYAHLCDDTQKAAQINEYENTWLAKDGTPLRIAWQFTGLCDESHGVQYIVSVGSEISHQRQIEEALRESEERYALALRGANDGIWDWNLETDEVYYSPRWKAMLDYPEDEIGSRLEEWLGRVHPADRAALQEAISRHLAGQTPHLECEYRILHQDGTYRWMLARGLVVRDAEGKPHRMAGSQTDMTERKIAEQQLLHDVYHDALTGLPNRVVFLERVQQLLARAQRRDDYVFAVLFLDLNNFKEVNDTLGHPIGDQLLKAVAARLKRCLRRDDTIAREAPLVAPISPAPNSSPTTTSLPATSVFTDGKVGERPKPSSDGADMVARLGGDEFTVVLEDVADGAEAIAVARRIYEELDQPFHLSGEIIKAGVSIGIVLSSPAHQKPEDLLSQADTAMYEAKEKAKRSGRSQACLFKTQEKGTLKASP